MKIKLLLTGALAVAVVGLVASNMNGKSNPAAKSIAANTPESKVARSKPGETKSVTFYIDGMS